MSETHYPSGKSQPLRSAHLTLIAGVAQNRVIGRDNQLPWRLPEDLTFFKNATLGHPIVMGRKTFESIGRPLPGRRNLVVTRDTARKLEGVEFYASLDDAVAACDANEEIFIVGGAGLYAEALARADRLLITEIERDFEGDTLFPVIPAEFTEISRLPGTSAADPTLRFAWVDYRREASEPSGLVV